MHVEPEKCPCMLQYSMLRHVQLTWSSQVGDWEEWGLDSKG